MAIFLSDALMSQQSRSVSGDRALFDREAIREAITLSKNYAAHDGTDPSKASALLLFQTSRQRTWLIRTEKRLYCVLDDTSKPAPHVNWSLSNSDYLDSTGKLTIEVREQNWTSDSGRTGKVDIGPKHKNWLFSRNLFQSMPVEKQITALLTAAT